ncbi:hypothetical protein Cgig2_005194 [Carnegiea gigantea]|uniref:Diphthine--ammonia ligase n=1 Tax=Carnegiea gigantea TaxID=171969 RepID=A0A9Q1KG53_9CARY|nr:hypothetical protein Cgig2_005194 [Carnegiea gigantea]
MKVVALVSGGKDSCYAMMQCIRYGHEIVALANLLPVDDSVDELDSYMYQTVSLLILVLAIKLLSAMQNAWDCHCSEGDYKDLPGKLFKQDCFAWGNFFERHHELSYKRTPGDEVEDMFILLSEVKRQIPAITAVSSGAIASDYQRLRVENVCSRLGFVSLAYLWKQEQSLLLHKMITSGIIAILVKVAAIGLHPAKHLGKEIADLESHLHRLNGLYGINVCGEGGEYETLTVDCPLFKFARIVLDDFQVVLHSSDSIAPVGVLQPLAFHLEPKELSTASCGSNFNNGVCLEEMTSVYEVEGDCALVVTDGSQGPHSLSDFTDTTYKVQMSKTDGGNTFSISCWLQDVPGSSTGVQDDLKVVLSNVELRLMQEGLGWENVLYIHLYIADMNEFAVANETYVNFITQEKCQFGVPSRSTIELPLLEAGLGKAYAEVLVSRDQTKKVLHVQSISCWAPSCIGPYSQATLHHGVLHMAGQLGLDPPTMTLCNGGPAAELGQALLNSEAVAKCFDCSISTSSVGFTVYCSARVVSLNLTQLQEKWVGFLEQLRDLHSAEKSGSKVPDPVLLFVLVPDLPKRALVEVKPTLFNMESTESTVSINSVHQACAPLETYWGYHQESWHDACLQKCIVPPHICTILLSITSEDIEKVCQDFTVADDIAHPHPLSHGQAEKIAKFCIYLINGILTENLFPWQDIMSMRIYFQTVVMGQMERLSLIFSKAFQEFSEINPDFRSSHEPTFNLIPVLGSGRSATSMDAVLTCELLAQKASQ